MAGQIVRVWKGYGTEAGVDRYCRDHFPNSVLPHLRSIHGFVGARVLTRPGTRRNRARRRHRLGLNRLGQSVRGRKLRRSGRGAGRS